jgi:hypothetical protein
MRLIIAVCLFFFSLAVQSAPPFIPPVGGPGVSDCDLSNSIDVPQFSLCLQDMDSDGFPDTSPMPCLLGISVFAKFYGQVVFLPQCMSPANLPDTVAIYDLIGLLQIISYVMSAFAGAIFIVLVMQE